MAAKHQIKREYSLGGISDTAPLQIRDWLALLTFAIGVAGAIGLLSPLLTSLSTVLPSVGHLTPERASRGIRISAHFAVALTIWTDAWALFPATDQSRVPRFGNLLRWFALIILILVITLALKICFDESEYGRFLECMLIIVVGFRITVQPSATAKSDDSDAAGVEEK